MSDVFYNSLLSYIFYPQISEKNTELYYCNGNIWKHKKKCAALLFKEQCNSVLIAVWKTQNEARAFVKLSSITHINWQCTPGINWSEPGIWQLWQIGMLFSEKREHAEHWELFFILIICPHKEPLEILGSGLAAVWYLLSPFHMEELIGNAFGSPGQPAFPKMRACGKQFSSSKATGLMDFSTNQFPNNEPAVQLLAKANEHTLSHSERRWKAHIQDALIWKQVYFCVWGVLFSLPSI